MKKVYAVSFLLVVISLAWCTLKGPKISEVLTGNVLTWVEVTGGITTTTGNAMEEFTWAFDSWIVPMVTGSESTGLNNETIARFKDLVLKRKWAQKDETKLTEDDIGFMEEIIEKVKSLGK